jgi:hypothetical protein
MNIALLIRMLDYPSVLELLTCQARPANLLAAASDCKENYLQRFPHMSHEVGCATVQHPSLRNCTENTREAALQSDLLHDCWFRCYDNNQCMILKQS